MKRKFEKISFDQFKKDVSDNKELYEEYNLPVRKTKTSAGYDFFAIEDIMLKPGERKKIPTGVKVSMQKDEFLMIVVRSSLGFKYNVRLCNQVGILDSDYYNNKGNEGHVFVKLQNHGEEEFSVEKGDSYVQGIFMKYLVVDDEEKIINERAGGFGSTS